jgi:DNA-binding NtrC family response regulator
MREAARRIQRAGGADCPVLIWGEPGSGRKFVAEIIHRLSRRAGHPIVLLRTQDQTEEGIAGWLLDDDHSGPSQHSGRLAATAGGTLLVDEVTGLSPTIQAKLLGALEHRRRLALENFSDAPADFRLMAATRFDPSESVQRGLLREDLYYRLGVVTIQVPPLRQRREDVPELVRGLLAERADAAGRPVPSLAPELIQYALEYSWPGNVRELRDCLETILRASDARMLTEDDLRRAISHGESTGSSTAAQERPIPSLADQEHAAVMQALEAHQGNRTRAARTLGISVRTLQRRLRRWKTH